MKKLSDSEKALKKIIKEKEKKFGLKYDDVESPESKSYMLYSSMDVDSYSDYKSKASFYGYPVLKKSELFAWYQMFFEVKADVVLSCSKTSDPNVYIKNIPTKSSKWTSKELKVLKGYITENYK